MRILPQYQLERLFLQFALVYITVGQIWDEPSHPVTKEKWDIFSPKYPDLYENGTSCFWKLEAEKDSKITVICNLNIYQTHNCEEDNLKISLSGNEILKDAITFCGKYSFNQTSIANKMMIHFTSSENTPGGFFHCQAYAHSSKQCNCGNKYQLNIVGGNETGVNEFPMMAGLVDMTRLLIKCGAVIISEYTVLTAAHCLKSLKNGFKLNDLKVVVGEHDWKTGYETTATQLIDIYNWKMHEFYNPKTDENDIGIINLAYPIRFSDRVGPVCLPFSFHKAVLEYQYVEVLGWGHDEFGGRQQPKLQKAKVQIQPPCVCRKYYGNKFYKRKQLCTYTPGVDSCQNDSGGPLLWTDPNTRTLYLLGIISYGIECATRPSVNTNIIPYLTWIYENSYNAGKICVAD